MEFENIFITGASSGIGAVLSELYAFPGVTLGLLSRESTPLEEIASVCRKKGATVYTYISDVTDAKALVQCALRFQQCVGKVDLVIANAGIRIEEDMDYTNWQIPAKVMQTNYLGAINTFSSFIPAMKENRAGHLAVISSIAAFRGTPNSGAYSASKAAINVWTESLRLRLKPYEIHVSTLCAGFVNTKMTSDLSFWMPGLISAKEAAEIIVSAIRRRKRVMTFPWQARYIWAFFRILPGPIYDKIILWAKAHHPKRK